MKTPTDHADRRLLSLYSALSACDSAIIRKSNRADLFNAICQQIGSMCDMGLVWIGVVPNAGAKIVPVAHYAPDLNYLDWIRLTLEMDDLPLQRFAGLAMHEARALWSADVSTDMQMTTSMHDLAKMQGWHSAAVLPLTLGGVAMGALSLYARESNAFNHRERGLLLQLASNISYALDYFALEEQREKAEYALLESEIRYSALFANNGIPMLVIDPQDGRIVDANIKAMAFYGWQPTALGSLCIADVSVLPPEPTPTDSDLMLRWQHSPLEVRHRLASGTVCDVEIFSNPISFGGKSYLIFAVHDITQRRSLEVRVQAAQLALQQRVAELEVLNQKLSQAQMQLLQSEKMASIGQLAAGVAHEINNPIGFVKSNLGTLATYVENLVAIIAAYEAAEQQLGHSMAEAFAAVHACKAEHDYDYLVPDLLQLIAESREGVQRVSQIVLDLKNFSRAGNDARQWCDLHAGMESTINVVWNQLKYKVELVRDYANPLPQVYCVVSQINQVFMNLLLNAAQAISAHGRITLRTGRQAEVVWFEVQDEGCGMAPETQAKIFEPFFTTKPVGQGTGLGLPIAFDIVQRHHGSITVQSAPGVGSTFRVTLPINADAVVSQEVAAP